MAKLRQHSRDDRLAFDFWESYYKDYQSTDSIDYNESPEDIEERKKRLEATPEEWFKYYFEKYCTAEPAPFHKRSTKRILNNPEWYEVRPWSRELAKSGRTMMEATYLTLTGKKRLWVLASATNDSAVKLLKPFRLTFEKNRRIIHDYGEQKTFGDWKEDLFYTKSGALFVAIGAGNTPRGIRNEEVRPDGIIVDDFDTDEDCRNPDIVDKKWNWFEKALYAARSISEPLLVIFNGNIIADYCCIKKAMEMADKYEIVNIRDKNGKSSWAAKNSEAHIDRVLSKINAASVQGEYFNNPIVTGKVFDKLHYCKMQPLRKYKFLVAYTDPSYKKNADYKATALVGRYKDEYHVLKIYCSQQASVADMLDWQFEILNDYANKVAVYFFIEYPWIDDTLKREIKKANQRHGQTLALKSDADARPKKPEKFYRIESKLEPLNRNGKLLFNQELEDKPMMKEAEFQFLALSPKSRAHDDAPDAVEGAVWNIDHKAKQDIAPPKIWTPPTNNKRY